MLDSEVKKILNENYNAQQKQMRKIVKLPCGHANVEITRPGDQLMQCPFCHKKSYLTWSRQEKHKIHYEGN